MKLSSSNIAKILILSQNSISQNRTLQFSAQALKIKELHPRKIYCTSRNGNPPKI